MIEKIQYSKISSISFHAKCQRKSFAYIKDLLAYVHEVHLDLLNLIPDECLFPQIHYLFYVMLCTNIDIDCTDKNNVIISNCKWSFLTFHYRLMELFGKLLIEEQEI